MEILWKKKSKKKINKLVYVLDDGNMEKVERMMVGCIYTIQWI